MKTTFEYLFSSGSDGKESVCKAGDLSSIPGSGGSPGEGNGNLLQYSFLENPWRSPVGYSPKGHKDGCFIMLCQFLLCSKVNMYIYIYIIVV